MVDNIPSLYPEVVEASTPPGKGKWGYFQRLRDDWIVMHGAWPTAQSDMAFKGYRFMQQFGVFELPGPGAGSNVRDLRGLAFNPSEEPWRIILQHKDGAASFSVARIIAYRWHIRPPYREVSFPQLAGVQVYDLFCPECEKGIFSSPIEQEAADLLRQHLTSRFDAVHSYRPEDLKALGADIGVDFYAARRRGTRESVRGASFEAPVELPAMEQSEEYRCNDCGETFDSRAERMRHGKSCPSKNKELSAAPA